MVSYLLLPDLQVELQEQQRGSSAGSQTPPLGSPHPSYCEDQLGLLGRSHAPQPKQNSRGRVASARMAGPPV